MELPKTAAEVIYTLNDEFAYIKENYLRIRENIERAGGARFMAVTKTVPPEKVNYSLSLGIDLIGENRVQEYLSKEQDYSPVKMHFIGHLQTNKVKYIIGRAEMIQSVDSIPLAREIARLSGKAGIVTDILLEVNIGAEESKSGFSPEETDSAAAEISEMSGLKVRGLMTIPPPERPSYYFGQMKKLFDDLSPKPYFDADILSMGMSADYETAIKCGSNLVRIGSALYGARPKK